MIKHIMLFGAGKSASVLIRYLLKECTLNNWRLIVADAKLDLAQSKIGSSSFAEARQVQVENQEQRSSLIKESDVVISLLPPSLHFLVAGDCLMYGKHLLTASYMDNNIMSLSSAIKQKGLLFLCEMGLDPGIDHMSAVQMLDTIKKRGGSITSFKSHCGGLVAPESDDNPWHYKISWSPGNVVRAGSSGAMFLEDNVVVKVDYEQLFDHYKTVFIEGIGQLAYYPNRDSLPYLELYGLHDVSTFIRTTLRHPDYCSAWNGLVNAGLTNYSELTNTTKQNFKNWSAPLLPFINSANKNQFEYLGVFDEQIIPVHLNTSADILQDLLEKKLMMQSSDKDMIVMLHEIEFYIEGILHKTNSLLIQKGDDNINTAMAKTVGLPLGIAASLILKEKILLTGLHIPVIAEVYDPVLKELEAEGIKFEEMTVD